MEKYLAVMVGLNSCKWRLNSAADNTDSTRYGMILAKDKNEEEAMRWLVRSIHIYPMNWGCWLEMTALINRVEDVS